MESMFAGKEKTKHVTVFYTLPCYMEKSEDMQYALKNHAHWAFYLRKW